MTAVEDAQASQESTAPDANRPTLSVVMPVFDAMRFLDRSLPPVAAALGRDVLEWIVVDDGSTDGSPECAAGQGARVLASGGRLGPAEARNVGARAARGDVLLFIDADVVMRADVPARLRAAFGRREHGDVVAIFGSYDDAPPDPAFASGYMNLRHHFVHQRSAGEASTFWAGLGAVRREAFLAVGGFDGARYSRPAIEDIELGYRLRDAGGRILLDPSVQGTHLKIWTWREVLRTDVLCRALPWSRLLHERPGAAGGLNVQPAERARAALAGVLVITIAASLCGVAPAWTVVAAPCLAVLANARLAAFFARRRGVGFAAVAMLWHQLYYLYSAAVFVYAGLRHRVTPRGRNPRSPA
jgi:glycosyltransferase involved in cell wall biosynthesis